MSTADSKPGHGAAWANLIVCGGISWAVSLWHATHATKGGGAILAVLIATAPVVTAAFASHHVVKKGAKLAKRVMTCIVFAMGMALSIKAQAQSVGPYVGGIELGVVFALMLDVSSFLALSSIMSGGSIEASDTRLPEHLGSVRTDASGASAAASVRRVPERLPDVAQTPSGASAQTRSQTSATAPKKAKQTPKKKADPKPSMRQQIREVLIETPEMNAADVARKIGRTPTGHIRTTCNNVLAELIESGAIDAPPLRIAQ